MALHIESIATKFYSWRSQQSKPKAQIDMILERADGIINVVEMKYSDAEYMLDSSETRNIRNRVETFRKETGVKEALWPTLVTTYGLHNGIHSSTFVATLTMDDLFQS